MQIYISLLAIKNVFYLFANKIPIIGAKRIAAKILKRFGSHDMKNHKIYNAKEPVSYYKCS